MKVLLLITDLYKTTGGGQTIYKKLINLLPQVTFYFFVENENKNLPSNCVPIKLKNLKNITLNKRYTSTEIIGIKILNRFAKSVQGMSFDFVEFPDYLVFSDSFISIFNQYNIKVRGFVLSLHGRMTVSNNLNWNKTDNCNKINILPEELKQYKSVDFVYGISPAYIKFYQNIFKRDILFIDPINFIDIKKIKVEDQNTLPDIYTIGRTERLKGGDIFIEICKWLDSNGYNSLNIVGEEDFSNYGISSKQILEDYADSRGLKINFLNNLNKEQLSQVYNKNSIIILPTRYDTLNLVALEAIFSGNLVAISDQAGVCEYLDNYYPGLPYVKINFNNIFESYKEINNLILNYNKIKAELLRYIENLEKKRELNNIYEFFSLQLNTNSKNEIIQVSYKENFFDIKHLLVRNFTSFINKKTLNVLLSARKNPLFFLKYSIKKLKVNSIFFRIFDLLKSYKFITYFTFSKYKEEQEVILKYNNTYFRYTIWFNLHKLYLQHNKNLQSVVYALRCLKLNFFISEIDLKQISNILIESKYVNEELAFQTMFSHDQNNDAEIYKYLCQSFEKNRIPKNEQYELIEDLRFDKKPLVSIIVSLYNAADKLDLFLSALSHQFLDNKITAEVILVDSGSPSNELSIFRKFSSINNLNFLYLRTKSRETIQAAWNCGIQKSNGKYLVFLGVDETLYPNALQILANQLESDQNIDWVMSNSLVLEVDNHAILRYDSLKYDRFEGSKEHVYLDTCYLSWVGGMYKKSIHDRFGYYDESFKAAGDTEFKNRILKHINIKFIDETLGVFLNYPGERATTSFLAEIEDLRAWYIYKTNGGIKYLFENYNYEQLEKVFINSLSFRRTFSFEYSTDFSYSIKLAKFILQKFPNSKKIFKIQEDLNILLKRVHFLNKEQSRLNKIFILFYPIYLNFLSIYFQIKHQIILNKKLRYRIYNDTLYQQHYWIW